MNLAISVRFLGWILLAAAVTARPVYGGVILPVESPQTFERRTVEALIFQDGEHVHLVTRLSFESAERRGDTVAWIIPLPSLPLSYATERGALFDELKAAEMTTNDASAPRQPTAPTTPSSEAASYEITPVEVPAGSKGTEINRWLAHAGFPPLAIEGQRPYLDRGGVLLAVKAKIPPTGPVTFKPIHLIYRANEMAFPIKLFGDSGPIALEVHFFTKRPIPKYMKLWWAGKHFTSSTSLPYKAPDTHAELRELLGAGDGYLTTFQATTPPPLHGEKNFVARLRDDPSLPNKIP